MSYECLLSSQGTSSSSGRRRVPLSGPSGGRARCVRWPGCSDVRETHRRHRRGKVRGAAGQKGGQGRDGTGWGADWGAKTWENHHFRPGWHEPVELSPSQLITPLWHSSGRTSVAPQGSSLFSVSQQPAPGHTAARVLPHLPDPRRDGWMDGGWMDADGAWWCMALVLGQHPPLPPNAALGTLPTPRTLLLDVGGRAAAANAAAGSWPTLT